MKPTLIEFTRFTDEVRRLSKKYPHLENDLKNFYPDFLDNPLLRADAIPGFERKLWKIRVRSTDQQRGKSGGFRVIFYVHESRPEAVHLLTIYPKSEREDLSGKELLELYKRFLVAKKV